MYYNQHIIPFISTFLVNFTEKTDWLKMSLRMTCWKVTKKVLDERPILVKELNTGVRSCWLLFVCLLRIGCGAHTAPELLHLVRSSKTKEFRINNVLNVYYLCPFSINVSYNYLISLNIIIFFFLITNSFV